MKYLLGFNEPWDTSPSLKWKKYISPADAAKYYGEFHIPIAKALGLTLVTPSTIKVPKRVDWIVEFF